jgi:hypothetical protein
MKKLRKLTLSRETIYGLDRAPLKEAAGGFQTLRTCPPPDTNYPCQSVDYCPTISCGIVPASGCCGV